MKYIFGSAGGSGVLENEVEDEVENDDERQTTRGAFCQSAPRSIRAITTQEFGPG